MSEMNNVNAVICRRTHLLLVLLSAVSVADIQLPLKTQQSVQIYSEIITSAQLVTTAA